MKKGFRKLGQKEIMKKGDIFVFDNGREMTVDGIAGDCVEYHSQDDIHKCFRKITRRKAAVKTVRPKAARTTNAMATALLNDCREAMLMLPPEVFDRIKKDCPFYTAVIERLNNALNNIGAEAH